MMQLYDATNKQGLCQEIDRLCDTTDSSYPRVDKTSRINNSYEMVVGWLIHADGTWQFDDTNYTDQPRGTGTLFEGQEAYSFASEYLTIEAIEVLNTSNVYVRLKPIDHLNLDGLSPQEYFGTDGSGNPSTGFPEYYDKKGDTIRLYPAPTATSVTLTNGLRLWFQRTASLFTVASDTSADSTEPGFASPYHVILAYMASIPYCMIYHPDRVGLYEKRVEGLKKDLLAHFSKREKDTRYIMTPKGNRRKYRNYI